MKRTCAISTAVLFLLIGNTVRAYPPQDQQQDQQGKKQDKPDKQSKDEKQQQEQNRQQQDRVRQQDENKQQQQQGVRQQEQNRQQQQDRVRQQDENKQQQQQGVRQQEQNRQQQQQTNRQEQRVEQSEQRSAWQEHRAHSWQSEHRTWQERGGYNGYRIPDDRFHGRFGRDHRFRIYSLPLVVVGGYPRFQYGGYWIGLIDPWPEYWSDDWYENDDVYIDYTDDGYYLFNRRYPGDRLSVIVFVS